MTNPAQAAEKQGYRRNLELGFIAALLLVLFAFLFFPRQEPRELVGSLESVVFYFADDGIESPEIVPAEFPRVPIESVLEDVREVESPLELPRPAEPQSRPSLPKTIGEELESYDFPPRPVDIVRPDYPEAARREGIEGRVRLRVVVSADGYVEDAWVLDAELAQFGETAVKAVRYWRFRPAVRDGRPVRASIIIPIEFVLTEAERGT